MKYNIDFDVAALALCLIILVHFLHRKSIRVSQTRVFAGLVWTCMLTALLDIVTVLAETLAFPAPLYCALNVVYLILFNALPFMYYFYLLISVRGYHAWSLWDKLLLFVPVTFSVLLILSSPLTGIVFRYTRDEGYVHGWGFGLLYIATLIYIVASVVLSLRHRAEMSGWKRLTVYCYVFFCSLGILIQALFPHLLVLQFAVTITLLLLYMFLESPNDDEDKQLEIYNRRGFDKLIATKVERQEPFHILVISMPNFHTLRDAVGAEFSQVMLRRIVEELQESLHTRELFCLAGSKLAVVVEQNKLELDRTLNAIHEVLRPPIVIENMHLLMEINLLQIDFPQEVSSLEDVMGAVDYFDLMQFENDDGQVVHGSADILRMKRREGQVLQAMKHALLEGTFEVYYQPIYSAAKGGFNSAEALLRLRDPELGFIRPDEFIPIAEKNGMILEIGEFVFRATCQLLAQERLWEKGIDYIEVNLSVVQCMQENISKKFFAIMDEYHLPHSTISLEITESTLAQEALGDTMRRMTAGGVTFALDDYGTGYSNLTNILRYPFHIIKLDKSMVWYAMENDTAMLALRHTVAMIRALGMCTLAEGVETEEQKKVLEEMGCEFLQGYYFSKPLPVAEFLEKIQEG